MRGVHETACVRSHPEIFGYRKEAIIKKFYIYGNSDQKFERRPRRLNQNIPLLMDHFGFTAHSNNALQKTLHPLIIGLIVMLTNHHQRYLTPNQIYET